MALQKEGEIADKPDAKQSKHEAGRGTAEKAESAGNDWLEMAKWLAAGFVIVAIAVMLARAVGFNPLGSGQRVSMIDGMRVESDGDPRAGLAKVLSAEPQIVREEMVNASDSRNSAVIIIASEVIRSLATANRNVSSYVAAYDLAGASKAPEMLGCNANNSDCGKPTITVRYGACNCLKISGETGLLVIEGDDSFASTETSKVGGIINMVLDDIKKSNG